MKSNIQETIVALVLVVLLLLILNPYDFWMPDMAHLTALVALLIAFGVFASYILREKIIDERDAVHRMFAGRAAFLAGSTVLLVGILIGAWKDAVDSWLILSLVVMVLTKIGARFYSDRNL